MRDVSYAISDTEKNFFSWWILIRLKFSSKDNTEIYIYSI